MRCISYLISNIFDCVLARSLQIVYFKNKIKKMNICNKAEFWTPCEELVAQYKNTDYAVVVLNTPISFNCSKKFIVNLWNQAKVRVLVDGGAKRWLEWLTMNECEYDAILKPDLLTGDLDSLSTEVLNYFHKDGAKVIVTPDQNETDYTKALRELHKYSKSQNKIINTIYVLADTSGRFDQIMANVNTLFKCRDIFECTKIYQVASSSLTWLLSKGNHSISIPNSLRKSQEWCSLIPIGGPCIITSSGLKWNLENRKLEFGTLVSTSNTYDGSPVVTVETDEPVVWSMGIDTLL